MYMSGVQILGIAITTMRQRMPGYGKMEEIIRIGCCAAVLGTTVLGFVVLRFASTATQIFVSTITVFVWLGTFNLFSFTLLLFFPPLAGR